MILLFYLLAPKPVEVLSLPQDFGSMRVDNQLIYLAPYFGKTIFQVELGTGHKCRILSSFTENENYRIYNFAVTRSSVYLNNGRALERFYPVSGTTEVLYSGRDISSFVITPSEEIILADQQNQEMVFLDFTNRIRMRKKNIAVVDLYFATGIIYALTKKSLLMFDEYSNLIEKKQIPESHSRIFVANGIIYLFSPGREYVHLHDKNWQKISFPEKIVDFSVSDGRYLILGNRGNNVAIYNISDF